VGLNKNFTGHLSTLPGLLFGSQATARIEKNLENAKSFPKGLPQNFSADDTWGKIVFALIIFCLK